MLSVAMFPFGCYSLCALLFYGFLTHTHINWPESPMVSTESIHKRWYLSLIVLSYNLRNTIIFIVVALLSSYYIRINTIYDNFCRIWTLFSTLIFSKQLYKNKWKKEMFLDSETTVNETMINRLLNTEMTFYSKCSESTQHNLLRGLHL